MKARARPTATTYASKAEARYADRLERLRLAGEIHLWRYEPARWCIGLGARYTPDFMVIESDGAVTWHEVKGHMREAARVRLRVAAKLYPEFRWVIAWARKGTFHIEEVVA